MGIEQRSSQSQTAVGTADAVERPITPRLQAAERPRPRKRRQDAPSSREPKASPSYGAFRFAISPSIRPLGLTVRACVSRFTDTIPNFGR